MLWPHRSHTSYPIFELAIRRGEEDPVATIRMRNYFQLELLLDKIGLPYPERELKQKWLMVVAKVLNKHGFILTSYRSNRAKRGSVIWTKK